jgi:signal peptidase I
LKKNKPQDVKKNSDLEEVKPKKNVWRENIEAIIIALILALFIRTFIVQAFKIPSGSMMETLLVGDHILVNKFIYGVKIPFLDKTIIPINDPVAGDIIVFKFPKDPKKDFIKRVIGVEGDTVRITDKKVYVNDILQEEAYAAYTDPNIIPSGFSPRDNLGPVTVPEGSLFVMGDNRDNSHDGRFWGFVKLKSVKGKAFMIYWSWNREKFGVRWNRIGDLLK